MKLIYTKVGDYLLPNLTIKNQNYGEINKYGYLRLVYLREHKKGLYNTSFLMQNKLTSHLFSVSNEAENKINLLIENYKKEYKLTEKKKESNQLELVKLMNNYKNIAEEIVLNELIYN